MQMADPEPHAVTDRVDRNAFWQLPRPLRADGQARRTGVEIELAGLTEAQVAACVQDLWGGRIEAEDPTRIRVEGTRLGPVTVLRDSALARSGVEGVLLEALGDIVPVEVVTPPLAPADLPQADALVAALRAAGARGTRDALRFGFGMHLNPEVVDSTPGAILPVVRAYGLLEDWLRAADPLDPARRLLPFVDPWPRALVDRLAQPDRAPAREGGLADVAREGGLADVAREGGLAAAAGEGRLPGAIRQGGLADAGPEGGFVDAGMGASGAGPNAILGAMAGIPITGATARPDALRDLPDLVAAYLALTPTRNRGLDLLPLLEHLEPAKVRAALPEGRAKGGRPTFHYRLPEARVDEPGWSVAYEWNRWVLVERVASRPALLATLAEEWRAHRSALLSIRPDWARTVEAHLLAARIWEG